MRKASVVEVSVLAKSITQKLAWSGFEARILNALNFNKFYAEGVKKIIIALIGL